MHFSFAPVALILSVASAQSTFSLVTTSTSACAALPVLEACLASTQAIAASCGSTDYSCLCQKWTDVQTCFLQCPNDPRAVGTNSNKATYCSNASIYTTTTSSAISRAVSSPNAAPTNTGATETGSSGAVKVASSTSSGGVAAATSPASTAKNNANRDAINGGLLMGVAGIVGMFL